MIYLFVRVGVTLFLPHDSGPAQISSTVGNEEMANQVANSRCVPYRLVAKKRANMCYLHQYDTDLEVKRQAVSSVWNLESLPFFCRLFSFHEVFGNNMPPFYRYH